MSENTSHARRIREMLRCEFRNRDNLQTDAAFYHELQNLYQEYKREILAKTNEGVPDSDIKGFRNGLFVLSVGLFCFGRLDVAEDILDNIPGGRGNINRFAYVLNRLLPAPSDLNCVNNPMEFKQWLRKNRSQVRWDENLERYILENFQILSDVPVDYDLST
ncbi:MAG: hypothetical protein AAFY21_07825 [Cyanobacteria bacterium J06641_2]